MADEKKVSIELTLNELDELCEFANQKRVRCNPLPRRGWILFNPVGLAIPKKTLVRYAFKFTQAAGQFQIWRQQVDDLHV